MISIILPMRNLVELKDVAICSDNFILFTWVTPVGNYLTLEKKTKYLASQVHLVIFMTFKVKLGEGNGTPLQYSCLENPMDGGAWWAVVRGVAGSRTRLSDFPFTFMHWRRKWQPTPVFLPGESQGRRSLVGFRLWGRTESNTTEVT